MSPIKGRGRSFILPYMHLCEKVLGLVCTAVWWIFGRGRSFMKNGESSSGVKLTTTRAFLRFVDCNSQYETLTRFSYPKKQRAMIFARKYLRRSPPWTLIRNCLQRRLRHSNLWVDHRDWNFRYQLHLPPENPTSVQPQVSALRTTSTAMPRKSLYQARLIPSILPRLVAVSIR